MITFTEHIGVESVKDLTLAEAQRVIGVSRQTLMDWIQKGKIEARKSLGARGVWLLPAEAVEEKRKERIAWLRQEIEEITPSVEDFLAQ